jgi:hypothetical protein
MDQMKKSRISFVRQNRSTAEDEYRTWEKSAEQDGKK